MRILVDKGQQKDKHNEKHNYMKSCGVELEMVPLPFGDYILENNKVVDVLKRKSSRGIPVKKMDLIGTYTLCVDTKRDIQEVVGNICGKQHMRFRDECILAQNNGAKLIVLVENSDGVSILSDLRTWENPRVKIQKWITTPSGERRRVLAHEDATKGDTLAKAMRTMEEKYGVEFQFCRPEESGKRIIEILTRGANG